MKKTFNIFFLMLPPLAVILLYLPALNLALSGDDYQWLQLAHEAMLRPGKLFADLDTFFRPTSTWTMILERSIWGDRAGGFHLTNIVFHAIATFLMVLVSRRLGLSRMTSLIIAALWGCSVFSSEPAIRVASRHEDLLFIGWLGMMLAWPGRDERWTRARLIAATSCVLLALFSKETWIVTPGIALALDAAFRRLPLKRSLVNFARWLSFSALYSLIHFLLFPTTRGYFNATLPLIAKIPHQLSAFFYFETMVPMNFPFTWQSLLALIVIIFLGIFALKQRSMSGAFGLALLILPVLPTVLIPYLPTRYTALPYGGFLLLLSSSSESFLRMLSGHILRFTAVFFILLFAAVFIAGVVMVQAELDDASHVSQAHERLLAEALPIAGDFPFDRPVLVIRAESDNPLREIALAARGLPKIYYVRHADPYGLIDTAALFDWAVKKQDVLIRRFDDWESRFANSRAAVLVHRSGGFTWMSKDISDLELAGQQWSARGFPVRVISAVAASSPH